MTIGRGKSDLLSLRSTEAVGDDLILRHRESAGRTPDRHDGDLLQVGYTE